MNYQGTHRIQFGHKLTPAVKGLIIINTFIFIVMMLSGFNRANYIYLVRTFGLTPIMVTGNFAIWQFITYMFLHGGIAHVFFNMFGLWMFGCELESKWGSKEFLVYYLLTGLGGGLLTYLFLFNSSVPTIGASASIFGILTAYGLLFPDRKILLFFVIPIKAIYFVMIFGLMELFSSFNPGNSSIAYIAHLGGMATGVLYLFLIKKINLSFKKLRISLRIKFLIKKLQLNRYTKKRKQVEKLLEKVSSQGIHSLTEGEKKFLHKTRLEYSDKDDSTLH
ncbi:MAG: rhomboid family intramembrane serine protease [Spirochaetes bacterium]|nr:rhomboid family intramembrane serine protease [Spirochaetota bacterium]